ncbi:OmpA family protein [uncultured Maribacter sp.]|uniref:OmpA family protein n=1 Tax=uncultured Maribacter sp. TaxID=431308 RepID=UPI0026181E9D|nr:OmpA family protein [uncultured Maribacter sp.]
MRFKIAIIVLILFGSFTFGQNIKSKGDLYFYEYKYQKAIQEYVKEKKKWPLSIEQELNLADSYFKIKDYKNAALSYINVNKTNDTILSTHRFNKMLQSLSKNGEKIRVDAFLESKSHLLSRELLENYKFNKEILSNKQDIDNFHIKNLTINSTDADFSPAFYKDKILFSSNRKTAYKKGNKSSKNEYLDIYVAKLGNGGEPVNPNSFTGIPEFDFHEATPFYVEKYERLFYIRSNTNGGDMAFDENGKNALAIGSMDKNNVFSYLLKDLSTSFYYPFFDETNNRFYFSANFEDSYGGTDLYYVQTNNGQIMSAPINLGPKINTPANEIAPYIHNGSLYYSSDIFYGFGGMDVYKTNLKVAGGYSIPVNLGSGINSAQDDFGFIVKDSGNGLIGYFSSNRKGGVGDDDLYSFNVSREIGLKTFAIKGRVISLKNRLGINKAKVELTDSKGRIVKEIYTNEDGDYSFELPWLSQVSVIATKEGHSSFSVTFNEEGMAEAQKAPLNMGIVALNDLVEEKEEKTVIKLNKFYFDKGKSVVTPLIAKELDKVIKAIQNFPQLQLKIESHTSSKGWDTTNKKLSQKRADAIKIYLLQKGASVSNIVGALGYGEEKIINRCVNGAYCLDFLHKQNERSLIIVTNSL